MTYLVKSIHIQFLQVSLVMLVINLFTQSVSPGIDPTFCPSFSQSAGLSVSPSFCQSIISPSVTQSDSQSVILSGSPGFSQ